MPIAIGQKQIFVAVQAQNDNGVELPVGIFAKQYGIVALQDLKFVGEDDHLIDTVAIVRPVCGRDPHIVMSHIVQ